MPTCTRLGCGQDYASAGPCAYHPGQPIFHEGLKSWSCCKDKDSLSKPVTDFDAFLALPKCAQAPEHSNVKVEKKETGEEKRARLKTDGRKMEDGKEIFGEEKSKLGQPLSAAHIAGLNSMRIGEESNRNNSTSSQPPKEHVELEDTADVAVAEGSVCKRLGCDAKHPGGMRNREEESCTYHKGSPIFHEGSKGYSCCSRRVMDFDDFLGIQPCTSSRVGHLFLGAVEEQTRADGFEKVECRMDHYETPKDVHVTIYAKGVEQQDSKVEFEAEQIRISLSLPSAPNGNKRRYEKLLKPFAPIDASSSSFSLTKFKLELVLVKAQAGQGWLTLEANQRAHGYGTVW